MSSASEQLVDKMEIIDVTIRYCTALDSRDWSLLATCFTEGTRVRYQHPQDDDVHVGRGTACRRLKRPTGHMLVTQHVVSNHVVTTSRQRSEQSVLFARAASP